VREAINQAIDEEMARDDKVFVIGFYFLLIL
jgi:pyruvate/2-oxoglutarate/acetoin dehydrogenase E1 component